MASYKWSSARRKRDSDVSPVRGIAIPIDIVTDNRLPVGSGIYIYRIDVEGVGGKTDRIAVFIEKERLDNF